MTTINSTDALLQKMKDEGIKNVLIGNGFSLSHPDLKDCFEWDMHQAICKSWGDVIPHKSENCPEKDLNAIRINVTKKILQYYVDRLKEKISTNSDRLCELHKGYRESIKYSCEKFLSADSLKGGYIFTLNYDPLMYFEILKLLDAKTHFDGFVKKNDPGKDECIQNHYDGDDDEKTFLKQDYIKCKLEKYTRNGIIKVLYLHGSWVLQANEADELRKLSFEVGSEDMISPLFKSDRRPFLILEDRWRVKKAILEDDVYFNFCFEQLGKIEGNLLVFGCSFKNDDHIVNAIKSNSSSQKIFVTYKTEDDQRNLGKKFEGLGNVTYLGISDNVIWKEKP